MSENIALSSGLGEAKGHAQYRERVAKSSHTWQVADDPAEPFARIKRVDVEFAVPFQPVSRG